MRTIRHNNKGVTLIEMLIVVAIIGILAGIGVPNFVQMIRHHRLRAGTIELMTSIRQQRSRALSLSRRIRMTIDKATFSYDVERLNYVFYNLMKENPKDHPLIEEKGTGTDGVFEILASDVGFNGNDGIETLEITTISGTTQEDGVILTFSPAGTLTMTDLDEKSMSSISIKTRGGNLGFELRIYKGGQIAFLQL